MVTVGMGEEYCLQLDLPPGSTYRAAARKLAEILGHELSPHGDGPTHRA